MWTFQDFPLAPQKVKHLLRGQQPATKHVGLVFFVGNAMAAPFSCGFRRETLPKNRCAICSEAPKKLNIPMSLWIPRSGDLLALFFLAIGAIGRECGNESPRPGDCQKETTSKGWFGSFQVSGTFSHSPALWPSDLRFPFPPKNRLTIPT